VENTLLLAAKAAAEAMAPAMNNRLSTISSPVSSWLL
jgi:hypothetical protein